MNPRRLAAFAATLAIMLSACATRVSVPEIPILNSPAFKEAKREPDEKPPVKIVEVPKPLPLPGQLKPVPEKKDKGKDDKQPKERVAEANARTSHRGANRVLRWLRPASSGRHGRAAPCDGAWPTAPEDR